MQKEIGNSPAFLLAAIVESSDDAIISKTLDGVITSWNSAAEELFEYTKEEAIGQHITIIIPKERLEEEKIIIEKIRRGERIHHFETERVTKSGKYIPLSITISPVLNERGEIIGASKVARDIVERKKAQEELVHKAQRKDEFIAVLGHELRNPLSPIVNALEILRMGTLRTEDDTWAIEIMGRQIKHMTRLIDDLLDIGRITADKLVLQRAVVPLSDVFTQALETSKPLIAERKHRLVVKLPEESIFINADVVRMSQVISNLLNNAAKYTELGGNISLIGEKRGAEVFITVHDTGIGLDENTIKNMFDLFVQAGENRSGKGGLGIGLALAKKLTEMHDGTIIAQSSGVGHGSTFTLRLPIAQNQVKPREEVGEDMRVSSMLKVLVVDDNLDAADTFNVVLRSKGWEVKTAYDGLEALRIAQECKPHVVLLDIGMPKLSGLDVARLIRKESWGENMLLVATTGWGQEADKLEYSKAGFDHHLSKPVDLPELFKIISLKFNSDAYRKTV